MHACPHQVLQSQAGEQQGLLQRGQALVEALQHRSRHRRCELEEGRFDRRQVQVGREGAGAPVLAARDQVPGAVCTVSRPPLPARLCSVGVPSEDAAQQGPAEGEVQPVVEFREEAGAARREGLETGGAGVQGRAAAGQEVGVMEELDVFTGGALRGEVLEREEQDGEGSGEDGRDKEGGEGGWLTSMAAAAAAVAAVVPAAAAAAACRVIFAVVPVFVDVTERGCEALDQRWQG